MAVLVEALVPPVVAVEALALPVVVVLLVVPLVAVVVSAAVAVEDTKRRIADVGG